MIVWRFARGMIPKNTRLQPFTHMVEIVCPLCGMEDETKPHIMLSCEVARILWFRLLGLNLHNFHFSTPFNFLVVVTFATNTLGDVSNIESQNKVTIVATIILKH